MRRTGSWGIIKDEDLGLARSTHLAALPLSSEGASPLALLLYQALLFCGHKLWRANSRLFQMASSLIFLGYFPQFILERITLPLSTWHVRCSPLYCSILGDWCPWPTRLPPDLSFLSHRKSIGIKLTKVDFPEPVDPMKAKRLSLCESACSITAREVVHSGRKHRENDTLLAAVDCDSAGKAERFKRDNRTWLIRLRIQGFEDNQDVPSS